MVEVVCCVLLLGSGRKEVIGRVGIVIEISRLRNIQEASNKFAVPQ